MGVLNNYFSDFVSLFFPNLCIGCDNLLPKNSKHICPKCHYNLPKTNTHLLEVPQFREKFQGVVDIEHILIYCYFVKGGIVQKLLHELKYGNLPEIGNTLGLWYGHDLFKNKMLNDYDLIVPVPLHNKRMKSRGYNQSEYFGHGLSKALDLPMNIQGLVKLKNIDSLTRKTKVNRIRSTSGVFGVTDKTAFTNKKILLVDDVLTTGSTLIAAIEALSQCKPNKISIATIAGVK